MNRFSEGYTRAIDQKWGHMAKIGFLGQKPGFRAQKYSLLYSNHVLTTTGKSCAKIKEPFSKIDISLLANFGCFFGKKRTFGKKKTAFGQT